MNYGNWWLGMLGEGGGKDKPATLNAMRIFLK